jgi:mRNA interferase MazF
LNAPDFASGGLLVTSFARPGKLFTAHAGLMVRSVGVLTPAAFTRVLSAVVAVLQPPPKS